MPNPQWDTLPKPNDSVTTTVVTTIHSKGKFMGILGLTYTGSSTTTTTTTDSSWQSMQKPTGTWGEPTKPSDSGWGDISKPTS